MEGHDPFQHECSFEKIKIIDLSRFLSIRKTKKSIFIDNKN